MKIFRNQCNQCGEQFDYDPSKRGRQFSKCPKCREKGPSVRTIECVQCRRNFDWQRKPGRLPTRCEECREASRILNQSPKNPSDSAPVEDGQSVPVRHRRSSKSKTIKGAERAALLDQRLRDAGKHHTQHQKP